MPHDRFVLSLQWVHSVHTLVWRLCCVLSLCYNGFTAINLVLGQGRGGFTLWYDYLSFCVMLPDGSVLWISV